MSNGGVCWTSNNVCVFDGMESIREICANWYTERLAEDNLARKSALSNPIGGVPPLIDEPILKADSPSSDVLPLSSGVHLFEAEPIIDRKSVFVGRVCHISDPSQVSMSDLFDLLPNHTKGNF